MNNSNTFSGINRLPEKVYFSSFRSSCMTRTSSTRWVPSLKAVFETKHQKLCLEEKKTALPCKFYMNERKMILSYSQITTCYVLFHFFIIYSEQDHWVNLSKLQNRRSIHLRCQKCHILTTTAIQAILYMTTKLCPIKS